MPIGRQQPLTRMSTEPPCLRATARRVVCRCSSAMTTGDRAREENRGGRAQHPTPTAASTCSQGGSGANGHVSPPLSLMMKRGTTTTAPPTTAVSSCSQDGCRVLRRRHDGEPLQLDEEGWLSQRDEGVTTTRRRDYHEPRRDMMGGATTTRQGATVTRPPPFRVWRFGFLFLS